MSKRKNSWLQELKNNNNYFRYMLELMNLQVTQFEYKDLPETIPAEFLEMFLCVNGSVGIGKPKGENDIYCAMGLYHGDVKGYLPGEYSAAVLGIDDIDGEINKNVVVGCNNLSRTPDFDIPAVADILCEIDISEHMNVIFSRLARLPLADNDKEKEQLESAIKSIIKGDPYAVVSRYNQNVFDEFLAESKKEKEKFLDLVDPDKINNLQYLNQYRDNIMKRFLMRRGYMFNVTTKLAQQTNDEIHGSDMFSILYPMEQLKCRKTMCENINKVFGLNVSVDYNPVLKRIIENTLNPPENVSHETVNETSETTDENIDDNNESVGDENDETNGEN